MNHLCNIKHKSIPIGIILILAALAGILFMYDKPTMLAGLFGFLPFLGSVIIFMVTLEYVEVTKDMVNQTKIQTELMIQPVVTIKIIPDLQHSGFLMLVLQNTGGGPAYDLSILFNPDLPYGNTTLNKLNIFRNMPMINKNDSFEFMFAQYESYIGKINNPRQAEASISYYSLPEHLRESSSKPIKTIINLDIDIWDQQRFFVTKGVHHLVEELREIKNYMAIDLATRDHDKNI